LLNEKMQKLEETIGKLVEEDPDTPVKSGSKEIFEFKSRRKVFFNILMSNNKRLQLENKILSELTGLAIKETRTKQNGAQQRNTSIFPHLPDYLRIDIEFNRDQLSRFFWRSLAALYKQETNEENGE
ncbi:hypothetical protein BCV72DRAFT_317539, partial [Rhizopus microsporus var. microsporus]